MAIRWFLSLYLLFSLSLQPLLAELQEWEDSTPEGISAQIYLSAERIYNDENLALILKLQYPESYSFDVNDLRQQFRGVDSPTEGLEWTLIEMHQSRKELDQGRWEQELKVELEPWLAGYYPTGIYQLNFIDESGKITTLRPPPFEVKVELQEESGGTRGSIANLLPVTDQSLIELDPQFKQDVLYDGEKQEKEAQRNEEIFAQRSLPWKLLIFLCVAVIALYFLRRLWGYVRKQTHSQEETDPRKKALGALQALLEQQLPKKGLFDPFYVQLTLIVRVFLEECYGLQAPEQTTEEFLSEVQNHPHLIEGKVEALAQFLSHADLIKFARAESSISDCQKALKSAESFIQNQSRSV